jgi:hypothetical protein
MLVILATQEAEIRRISVGSQPGRDPISKKTHHNKRTGRVAQGVDPEFKPQYCQKKKKKREKSQPTHQVGLGLGVSHR